MRTSLLAILSLGSILLIHPARGQEDPSPSVADIIRQVLEHNPQLQALRFNVGAAEGRRTMARAWDAPRVSVAFMDNPVTAFTGLRTGAERQYLIEQMVPFPGKRAAAAGAAEASSRAATSVVGFAERSVIALVKQNYAMVFSAQRRIDVNSRNQELLRHMVASVRAKYGVGLSTQADILRLETELAKLQNQRATLEHDLRVPEAMINTLRATPTTSSLGRLPDIHLKTFTYDPEELTRRAIEMRMDLQAMAQDRDMARYELSASEREWWPNLMVGAAYQQRGLMPDAWELMLGISLPIAPWASGMTSGRVQEHRSLLDRSEANLRDMQNMVRFEVFDAWLKAKAHWEQAERYRTRILPDAEQTLESLRIAYQTNKADFLSLIDAFRMLQMFHMEYYMEVADYLMHVAELERAVGADIDPAW